MKRKFSLFVAVACLCGSLSFGSFAQAVGSSSFSDVDSSTRYSNAIITLTKLGIINGYDNGDGTFSFKPEGEITRAEFTKIITVALGMEDSAAADNGALTDISDHWAKSNILLASARGIVNGFEDGTFRPDEQVTYEQAVKMIVCSAGYENGAIALGGWPNGFISQASSLGITKNAVASNQTAPATRGLVAQLVYNVLEVEIPAINTSTGRPESDLDTFMETYLGIIQEKATIAGVEDKVLSDFSDTLYIGEMAVKLKNGDVVRMDYTAYTEDKSVIEALLGQEANIFYKEGKGGDINVLVELDLETVKNTITTILSNDIDSFEGNSIKYYNETGKTKSISFDPNAVTVYYNGKAVSSSESRLEDWLDPSNTDFIYGELRLTDSGSNNSIDIIEITDYDFMVVTRTPSTTDYVITNKVKFKGGNPDGYRDTIALDPEAVKYSFTITNSKGDTVAPTSLKANDVLLVAASLNDDMYTVKVNSTPVTGKISAYSNDENEVTINSETYKLSDYAIKYFGENSIDVSTSTQGTFYVDTYGTIVYGTLSTSETSYLYAYIIKSVISEDQDSASITAYVPSASGVKTYSVSNKLLFNGQTTSVESVIEDLKDSSLMTTPDNGIYTGTDRDAMTAAANSSRLVRIVVTGTEIEEIVTEDTSLFGKTNEDTTKLVYFDYDGDGSDDDSKVENIVYKGSNNFDGKFYVNSSTTYIFIPQDRAKTSSYGKRTISSFSSGQGYYVRPYNVNSSKIANLVLVFGASASTSEPYNSTYAWILSEPIYTSVKDDDDVYTVSYYNSTATVTNKTADMDNISVTGKDYVDIGDIKVGDVFRTGIDSSQGLMNADMIFEYAEVKDAIDNDNCDFTSFCTDTSTGKWYSTTTGLAANAYGEAFVANVIEVLEDGDKYSLRLTSEGFDGSGNLPETADEEVITIESDTVIYSFNDAKTKVTPFLEGSDTERLTALDIDGAVNYGNKCSKVAVFSYGTTATTRKCKFIFIYE